jgi:iron(III) transport system ATP-binding protein
MSSAPVTSDTASIEVTGVTKSFGALRALDDLTLSVAAGEMVALLGPSGCGKTTLLRALAGLERPDKGAISIGGTVVDDDTTFVAPERRRVGLVFQDWALFPHMTVGENVAYGLGRDPAREARVRELLAMVGLDGMASRPPGTLSGGQQQRVALARAIAPRPAVLLLDEPFSNLDSSLRVELRTEVKRLLVELGITAVFVTHDQEEAFVLGDRVAVMRAGILEQIATPAELYTTPNNRWVATFVGEANVLAGEAHGATAVAAIGTCPLRVAQHGSVDLVVRPEQLALEPGDTATVELLEYYGHDARWWVRLDTGERLVVRMAPVGGFPRGTRVNVRHAGRPVAAFPATSSSPTG